MQTENTEKKRRFFFDLILVVAILSVALSVFLIFRSTKEKGATAEVYVNGELVAEYSLNEDGEYPIAGGTNILLIKDGAAFMKDATCPKRTCVTRSKNGISYDGERIDCEPNRVAIMISGGEG